MPSEKRRPGDFEEEAAQVRERTNCLARQPPIRDSAAVASAVDLSRVACALLATIDQLGERDRAQLRASLARLTDGSGAIGEQLDRPLEDLIGHAAEIAEDEPFQLIAALFTGLALTSGQASAGDLSPSRPNGATTIAPEPVVDRPGTRSTPSRS